MWPQLLMIKLNSFFQSCIKSVRLTNVCVFYGGLFKCVSLLCVQSFFPQSFPAVFGLSFTARFNTYLCCLWAGFFFCFSGICLANKSLTRQREGLGHCLDMKEHGGF